MSYRNGKCRTASTKRSITSVTFMVAQTPRRHFQNWFAFTSAHRSGRAPRREHSARSSRDKGAHWLTEFGAKRLATKDGSQTHSCAAEESCHERVFCGVPQVRTYLGVAGRASPGVVVSPSGGIDGNLQLPRAVVRRPVCLVSPCKAPLVSVVAQKGCGSRLEPFLVLLKALTKEAAAFSVAEAQRNALVGLSMLIEGQNSLGLRSDVGWFLDA